MNLSREFNAWPLTLCAIPFAAVLFGILMVSVASVFPDDVVVDDYYKEGMAINERLADSEKAVALGISAEIYLDGERVSAKILGSSNGLHQLSFHHVTDSTQDVTLNLTKQGDRFVAREVSEIQHQLSRPGIWYVDMTGVEQGWRITQRVTTPTNTLLLGSGR